MSNILVGEGSSPGIVIGPLHFLSAKQTELHTALRKTESEWKSALEQMPRIKAQKEGKILESYLHVVRDPTFLSVIAEIGRHLHQQHPLLLKDGNAKNKILVAETFNPEEVVRFHRMGAAGFITTRGGKNSHEMILARSLCIPAVSGIQAAGPALQGKEVILNGYEGKIIVEPTPADLKTHRELEQKHQTLEKILLDEAKRPAVTRDQKTIRIEANIELPEEVPTLLQCGAEGIGLLRTEPLYWKNGVAPVETDLLRYFQKIFTSLQGRPITIRTFDVSGEAWLRQTATNPALGLRGLRFALKEENLLRAQLRAILRAAQNTNFQNSVRLLLPMVTSMEEIDCFQKIFGSIQKEICKNRPPKTSIGMTIEVPAAALCIDRFAKVVDFFAIGTNDLTQYLLAWDRTFEPFAQTLPAFHPALFRLLVQIIQNAQKAKKPIHLCGELAGDPLFLPALLGLGIGHFSMNPLSIPFVKKMIRSLSIDECQKLTNRILTCDRSEEIEKELQNFRLKLDSR